LGDVFDNADAFNGTVAAEFALEVFRADAIGQARNEECLKGVALHFVIFGWFVIVDALGDQPFLSLLLLHLLLVALLQPAVRGDVSIIVLVLLHRLQVLSDAADLGRAALFRRVVGRFNPSQRRPRGEQVQEHWRE
jgi:hypothetical protein